jgi:hypothetical protein
LSLEQGLFGCGDVGILLAGSRGTELVEQDAYIFDGTIKTNQNIDVGSAISSSLDTEIAGSSGGLQVGTLSKEVMAFVEGSFIGSGGIDSSLRSLSSEGAVVDGSIAADGGLSLSREEIQGLQSRKLGMVLCGIRKNIDGDGVLFQISAMSMNKGSHISPVNEEKAGPACYSGIANTGIGSKESIAGYTAAISASSWQPESYGARAGSFNAYLRLGDIPGPSGEDRRCRWNQNNPQINIFLLTDSNFQNTGLDANEVVAAISRSAETWDKEISKNLFADNNLVMITPSIGVNDPYDG